MLATFFLVYLKLLYPSKIDVTDIVSTDWLKFRWKYIVFRRNLRYSYILSRLAPSLPALLRYWRTI